MRQLIVILSAALLALVGCAGTAVVPAAAQSARSVPVLMYHSVLRDPERTGKYIVSPERLEEDVVWLLENGYTIVTARALIEFAQGMGGLPEKPVLLTFDDGYYNNLTYVLPILEKYDCTAVVSIVGAYTQRYTDAPDPNPNYAYLSWDDVRALLLSDRIELANHSYNMHGQAGRKGSARRRGESVPAYAEAFLADVGRLQREIENRVRVTPSLFAYPFGMVDRDSRALLQKMGFSGSLTCDERISRVVAGDPSTLWELGRFNRQGDVATEAFMRRMGLAPDAR